ncbi:30S ribosome-binding factor RbfA [Gallibacter intestinalis]|uniref:Ribosome-binding factor A n=1 Tax=Gallibacter intestinalis TaxID=2779356 RepID=A0ABR9QXX5_9FIRM|nr:30S ribosome-binding factor RbfA [Gallibacter intestinalis]MBE5035730.1 30S ribosome-binding factor RbfA [Gallibacter intestinalis]
MGKGYRPGRLGEEIKKITSDLLLKELKDPRLEGSLVSVTAVDVTGDGSIATVYLSALKMGQQDNSKEYKDEILEAMRSCKGVIRREIGKNIKLRHVPDLIFKMDTSLEYGRHIDELIDSVVKKDEK